LERRRGETVLAKRKTTERVKLDVGKGKPVSLKGRRKRRRVSDISDAELEGEK